MLSTKYGISLPRSSSAALAGVAISASMVPRSHSRATTSDVSSVPVRAITMAIEPGTRKKRLDSSGLNQKRCWMLSCGVRIRVGARSSLARTPAHVATTPCVYPSTRFAVLGSEPSTITCSPELPSRRFWSATKLAGITTMPRMRPRISCCSNACRSCPRLASKKREA